MAASVDFQLAQLEVVPPEVPLKLLPPSQAVPEKKKRRPQTYFPGFSEMIDPKEQRNLLRRLEEFVNYKLAESEAVILLLKAAFDNPELLKLINFETDKTAQQIIDIIDVFSQIYPRQDTYYKNLLDRFIADAGMEP